MVRGPAIVAINGVGVKFAMHDEVVRRIREGGGALAVAVQGNPVPGDAPLEPPEPVAGRPTSAAPHLFGMSPSNMSVSLSGRRPSVATKISEEDAPEGPFVNPLYRRPDAP
jgi:hypothetical protein